MIKYKGKTYHPTMIWRLMELLSKDGYATLIYYDNAGRCWACRELGVINWHYAKSPYAALKKFMVANNLMDKESK